MTKKLWAIVAAIPLFLSACSAGDGTAKPSPPASVSMSQNGCSAPIHKNAALDKPGCYAVSTMARGQEFDTTPNFYFFKVCGRPCWLPIYSHPALVKDMAVTKGHPCEYYLPKTSSGYCEGVDIPADTVSVVCQVHGKLPPGRTGDTTLTDDAGHSSDIWDEIIVPLEDLVGSHAGLKSSPDGEGYLAFGSDLWLNNSGWHNIPCK
jgi:hypothetical protein